LGHTFIEVFGVKYNGQGGFGFEFVVFCASAFAGAFEFAVFRASALAGAIDMIATANPIQKNEEPLMAMSSDLRTARADDCAA